MANIFCGVKVVMDKISLKMQGNGKVTAVVLSLPIVMLLLLCPVEIYQSNITDFNFMLKDFVWGFLFTGIILWILSTLCIALLPKKMNRVICIIIFSFSVMAYIQNMFLNIKLAEIDGSVMDWSTLGSLPIINLIVWIVVIIAIMVVCIRLEKFQDKICLGVSAFLTLIQIVAYISCIITILNSGKLPSECVLSNKGRFEVAPNDNVILLVLDSMSNEMFDRAAMQDEEMLETLKDFTYYTNYDSLYVPTFPSMSHMLTGSDPELSKGRYYWLQNAWNSEKCVDFYARLHEKEYTCYLYGSMLDFVYGNSANLQGKFDNVENFKAHTNYRLMYPMMVKYMVYRYSPYILKPRFEVIPEYFTGVVYYDEMMVEINDHNDYFYDSICESGLKIDDNLKNAFIIEHLAGMHEPKNIDENANVVSDDVTDEQVVRGCFTILEEYFNQLKELGVYDNATIIILADHGTHHGDERQSIFFIKEKGACQSEMKENSAPITSDEYLATMLFLLGDDYSEYGNTIYDWQEGQIRERTSYYLYKGEIDKLEGYTYQTDRYELKEKLAGEPDIVK